MGTAANGVEAIELFKKTDPDVVTMDLTMPHMDGIECIGQLVALKPAVRILVDLGAGRQGDGGRGHGARRQRFPQQALHRPPAQRSDRGAHAVGTTCCTNRN